ncbi:MAG: alpha/beta hydrolase [Pseudomonadales bacterium]|nr:alpha/beta hydrolase [Pseudomonadales bacterium]
MVYSVPLSRRIAACLALILSTLSLEGQAMTTITDIEYASVGERRLLLDLYLPETESAAPLVIWIHGGAWRAGSKNKPPVLAIVAEGFALASLDFRNSPEAAFPAQMHDIKAAIRFLRAHAGQYAYRPDQIVLWGYSSGGHLAALAGLTGDEAALEGELGNHAGISSAVQAIIDYSGPTNFESILHQSTPHGLSVRVSALELLLGKAPTDPAIKELLHMASPVHQVDMNAPPLLILHGIQDNQVPINQSLELASAYRTQGRPVEVEWLLEAQHTSGEYFQTPYIRKVADFLHRVL